MARTIYSYMSHGVRRTAYTHMCAHNKNVKRKRKEEINVVRRWNRRHRFYISICSVLYILSVLYTSSRAIYLCVLACADTTFRIHFFGKIGHKAQMHRA